MHSYVVPLLTLPECLFMVADRCIQSSLRQKPSIEVELGKGGGGGYSLRFCFSVITNPFFLSPSSSASQWSHRSRCYRSESCGNHDFFSSPFTMAWNAISLADASYTSALASSSFRVATTPRLSHSAPVTCQMNVRQRNGVTVQLLQWKTQGLGASSRAEGVLS